jgi:hypothetical protein
MGNMAKVMAEADESGQGQLAGDLIVKVAQPFAAPSQTDKLRREDEITDTDSRAEGLAEGADIHHPVRVQTMEGAERWSVEPELAVVIVFNDESVGYLGIAQ